MYGNYICKCVCFVYVCVCVCVCVCKFEGKKYLIKLESLIIFTPWDFFTSVLANGLPQGLVKRSLLKSPGLFSALWSLSAMLLFGLSPVFVLFASPSVLLANFWWLYISTNYNWCNCNFHPPKVFWVFCNSLAWSRYLSFFSLSFNLICDQLGVQSLQFCKFSFCWLL